MKTRRNEEEQILKKKSKTRTVGVQKLCSWGVKSTDGGAVS